MPINTIFNSLIAILLCITAFTQSTFLIAQGSLSPEELVEIGLKAGQDYPGLNSICAINKPLRNAGIRKSKGTKRSLTDEERAKRSLKAFIEPRQVFDNLYFVGNRSVASWVIQTSEGLILIDAMNSNRQAKDIIVKGITTLGLNPNDIQYLIITHAHGDHYGGQEYLTTQFRPRVVMSDVDWSELEKPEPEIYNPKWGVAPTRDISANDGDTITLGDTRVQLYVTPGHTLGTLSLIFPVEDNGAKHTAALWGGTGLNFGPNIERLKMYSDSASRFQELSNILSVDVFLSNHPTRDNSVERMEQLSTRAKEDRHPFVDPNAVGAFSLLHNCSLAHIVKIDQYQQRVLQNK